MGLRKGTSFSTNVMVSSLVNVNQVASIRPGHFRVAVCRPRFIAA